MRSFRPTNSGAILARWSENTVKAPWFNAASTRLDGRFVAANRYQAATQRLRSGYEQRCYTEIIGSLWRHDGGHNPMRRKGVS